MTGREPLLPGRVVDPQQAAANRARAIHRARAERANRPPEPVTCTDIGPVPLRRPKLTLVPHPEDETPDD